MSQNKVGVLVMSYGTPESLDQIEAYYTHIRRGRPPSPEQLQDLRKRYEAIVGGVFPLRQHTNEQVKHLQELLNQQHPDVEFVCYQGLKHASPFIEDGVQQMVADGITEAVGIVLAPHYSVMSVGSYIQRAKATAEPKGLNIRFVESYHLHPKLIEALSERVLQTFERFPEEERDDVLVLFSAHSLPERILAMNDPYPQQLMETSRAIATQTGIKQWEFVWQSAGATPEPWLGPDILEVIEEKAAREHVKNILVCPIGFVSDHLEVLYDIDIECQNLARQLHVHLERTPSLNSDPKYIETLADEVWRGVLGG